MRSNAITSLGYTVERVHDAAGLDKARVLVFPGVGAFAAAAEFLSKDGMASAMKK